MNQQSGGVSMRVAPIDINWRPELPIFASQSFLSAVGDEYGWIGGFGESGEIRCVLPYTVVAKAGFRMVRFRIETIPMEDSLSLDEEQCFLNGIVGHFRSAG